ncbi:MAG: alcohol dehydrogenase catalytic domain-containing protein [Lachnospiraceae bacterium]|nr:alcohol dehydrogenase catalytic domain-containing protein [Lachnospiraceae bacterium]MDY6221885.1 scyllo-inosose 3-dehydrogenase [Candidatus Alectryocaccobium sp.]
MQGNMKAFMVEGEWAPKPDYILSPRELKEKRAMRADLVYKNVTTGLKSVPIPEISDDDVLIKVGACGVCGSDLHAIGRDAEGYSTFASHVKLPVILGHEFSGEVVEVGKNVTNTKVGDIISVEQIRWCGTCRVCRTGMFNQCENLEETGLSCDGAFAEYALVPQKYVCVINDIAERLGDKQAAFEAGALAEPTCVAYSGIQINSGGIKPGSNVAIFGVGPIGLASVELARAFGAAKIFVFNTNPARDYLAKAMGADYVFNPRTLKEQGTSAGEVVLDLTNGIGAGTIVEATGNFSEVYPEIMKCIGIGAHIVQLGIGAKPAIFDTMPLLRKNAHIIGSLGQAGSDIFPSVLRLMASGRIDMRKMITGRFKLDDVSRAIADSGKRELGHGKVMVSQFY